MKLQLIRTCGMPLKQYFGGRFIALSACTGKEEWPQINDLSLCLQKIRKKKSNLKAKASRKGGLMKIKALLNERKKKKRKSMKPKAGSLRFIKLTNL